MKHIFIFSLALATAIALASCSGGSMGSVKLKTAHDSASYALGVNTGASYAEASFPGEPLDLELMVAGFRQALLGKETLIQFDETVALLDNYFNNVQQMEAAANLEASKLFLSQNAAKEGVTETPSGLQYKVITMGSGEKPLATDVVTVHYTGKLTDGTVFDSSVERGEPASFGLDQVIEGWTEALQLMPVGSKFEIWLPAELGYGPQGIQGVIPPYSVLNFEVELLSINQE